MKPRLLFLVKVLLCTAGLFIIWHPVAQVYTVVLKRLLALLTASYELSDEGDLLIYKMSLYMIPFLSLMVITPQIPLLRRAGMTLLGMVLFLVLDLVFIQYVILAEGAADSTQSSADVLFQSLKLLLPLLLWILSTPAFFTRPAEKKAA